MKITTPIFLFLALPLAVRANPEGLTVQSGQASAVTSGNQLNVTASHNAFLNWQSFNIGAGETTSFIQPSAASIVWNRINDQNPSQIYGNLNANGVVVLMNRSGFYFGPNSFVSAAGLIVSTAPVAPVDSGAGLFWQFNGAPPSASIVNYGQLNVGPGGSAFLIAERVENHGAITAPQGNIGLIAGQEVLLSDRPDGRGLSATVRLPSGAVDNSGRLIADAGTIALNAQVVNQNGLVQANSIQERNGIIELVAVEAITLGDHSILSAEGGTGVSDGGNIKIKSDGLYADSTASHISVAGGAQGGNGGVVEISAPQMPSIRSTIDGHASASSTGGRLVIDPEDIALGNSATLDPNSPVTTLNLDVDSAFVGFSQISLQADHSITLLAGTLWDLFASTGIDSPGSLLKLEAGTDIIFNNNSRLVAGSGWSVTLQAGRNFSLADTVVAGVGDILFQGSGALETSDGAIQLLAGNNILVDQGFVHTIGGGSISAHAVSGSINTGTKTDAYGFYPFGYQLINPSELGGISTAQGGSVSLEAGLDIISYLPEEGVLTDAGSGAFGTAAGNVTLNAGRDVWGHFVLRNGIGTITAGRNAGKIENDQQQLLDLSLAKGGWTINAARDIKLNEVRNPNGMFNTAGSSRFLFDYAATAYTVLNGGNSVELLGSALRRVADGPVTPIYPGTLAITAGAGGVTLANDVILFPSATGNLTISTTDGGSLIGTKSGGLTLLVVSDSSKRSYRTAADFGISDHAATPLHLNDANPVQLDIDGDMKGIYLGVPKRAVINVGGDMVDSRFDGQNLHDTDVTSINVGGDIINRNEFTTIDLDDFGALAPDYSVFDLVYPPLTGGVAGLQNLFFYNPLTHALTFQGRMNGDILTALQNLRIRTFDANGFPILDANKEPVTAPAQFINAGALQALYDGSQDIPADPNNGYLIGGGGTFNINAHDLDLGATRGIVSQGPSGNRALAKYFTHGADINVSLSGDLDMFSTKIASLNGGDLTIVAGGEINVGATAFNVNDRVARGIYTTDDSDVTVIARGDININGSRIAAFDGGDVLVRSLEGDVDAGTGGRGSVAVEKIYVNPATRQILTYTPRIPGSGILATSFPKSRNAAFPASINAPGNIVVETPQGNINASGAGIVQLSLNGMLDSTHSVTLSAGEKLPNGTVLYPGSIFAGGSGVIALNGTASVDATGDIIGFFFANKVKLKAVRRVDAVALGRDVNVSGESIRGTYIGTESVTATGDDITASLLSQNVSSSGNLSDSQIGFDQGTAANSTSQSLQEDDSAKTLAADKKGDADEEAAKKRGGPRLAKTTGRVTVILPSKIN